MLRRTQRRHWHDFPSVLKAEREGRPRNFRELAAGDQGDFPEIRQDCTFLNYSEGCDRDGWDH